MSLILLIGVVVSLFLEQLIGWHLCSSTCCHILFSKHVTKVALLNLCSVRVTCRLRRLCHLLLLSGKKSVSDLLHRSRQRLLLLCHVLTCTSGLAWLRLLLTKEQARFELVLHTRGLLLL